MVRDAGAGVEMVRRNMEAELRDAFAALNAGQFAEACRMAARCQADPRGAALHAMSLAAGGNVEGGATALHALARANPRARHPVFDVLDLLRRAGQGGAAAHLRAALRHAPDDAGLLAALGAALAEDGSPTEAITIFQRIAAARPGDPDAATNLGKALAATGRFEEAEAAFARVPPRHPQRDLNHAVALLKAGKLHQGWPLFRARHALPGRAPPPPGPELRTLDGIAGRTVLLLHDEGFGDTLQFIRYAPMLARHGARVRVLAPPPLHRLLRGQGLDVVAAPPPGFDAWCRIPDLPGVFGTTAETIPAALPYLAPSPGLVDQWRPRLPPGRRIGLAWAGAARLGNGAAMATDRIRSISPGRLGPLLATQGVTWISLQHGQPAPSGMFDPMPGVADFADTAAIIASLDLVVSVDTAVAHLAAAMGTRVLLLDRYDNCWRWLHGRDDSPWYPGVLRIIRQASPGDWTGVLERVPAFLQPGRAEPGKNEPGSGARNSPDA